MRCERNDRRHLRENASEVRFVEQDFDNSYTCYPHGSFSGGPVNFRASRDSTGSNIIYGYISGVEYEGEGGISRSSNESYGWGEESGTSSCSGDSAFVEFSSFQKYNISSGWSNISSANNYVSGNSCFTKTSISSSQFDVSR
jgi:hypothetical protein